MNRSNDETEQQIIEAAEKIQYAIETMSRRLVGQGHVAERLLISLMCGGHVLLEGLPGLAKTTALKALSDCSDLHVKRIQFTPDLLPADVIGTQVYDPRESNFKVKKGPIFSNLVIADEINRAPAKVQSALLEAMQEKQVTIGDETFKLEEPFLVMATQNPIEQEGTYPLPEAQLDRFLFKVLVGYGSLDDEKQIILRNLSNEQIHLETCIDSNDFTLFQTLLSKVHVSDKLRHYIVELVCASRDPLSFGIAGLHNLIEVGASPRASINLERAVRALAIIRSRSYATPDDVKDLVHDVLRHRIKRSFEAEAEQISVDEIINKILSSISVL